MSGSSSTTRICITRGPYSTLTAGDRYSLAKKPGLAVSPTVAEGCVQIEPRDVHIAATCADPAAFSIKFPSRHRSVTKLLYGAGRCWRQKRESLALAIAPMT